VSETEKGFRGGSLPPRVGERLAAARTAQGLSIEEICARTRVPARHLVAIEEGDNDALPAAPYATGFVKTYAQVLGLDAAELGRDFRAELGNAREVRDYTAPFEPADPARVPSRALALVALVVAAVLAAAYLFWRIGGYGPDERATLAAGTAPEAATPAATAPAGAPPPAPRPATASQGPVAVTAKEAVWVKIYERDGPTLFQGEMTPGQRVEVPPSAADPLIWTGRPQAIGVTVGAQPVPPLGPADRRIRDVSLKRDALLAMLTPPAAAPPPQPAAPAAAAPLTPVDPEPAPAPAPAPAPDP
jgi:transcriptional regulator with XRE-family HTH domain